MQKQDLKSKNLTELSGICSQLDLSKFKAKEIFKFIHQKAKTSIDDFTTIKLTERNQLKELFYISAIAPLKTEKAKDVLKIAFELGDGKVIETVFMDYGKDRKTLCISSQVGCPIGCQFCATGKMGFKRDLTVSEILSQVYFFAKDHKISNIVFMGMGEPLLNFDNVMAAAKTLNNESGLNIASRKIVISTIGIIEGIKKFAGESKQLRLAWSLVSPFDEVRKKLIGHKGLPTISETVAALKDYQNKTKRRITIEYVLLKEVNDSENDQQQLVKISKNLDCHINLIPYNSTGPNYIGGDVDKFRSSLKKIDPNINVTIRKSLGQDISAACGQLSSTN